METRQNEKEQLGWKEHFIRQGDGKGGWLLKPAEYRFLHHPEGGLVLSFGLAQMDNGEVIFLGSRTHGKEQYAVFAIGRDGGDSWSEIQDLPDAVGRPMMLAYLGNGRLTFETEAGNLRYFSSDYGRTWTEKIPKQLTVGGKEWNGEGNPLVEQDARGLVTRMAEIGFTFPDNYRVELPVQPLLRWSVDGGRTWTNETAPKEWQWEAVYRGKIYHRGVSEGSLARAANGWLVAALRPDMPPEYYADPDKQSGRDYNDSVEGIAVSISRDDGKTWSPMNFLFSAGRHHCHLVRMPNGDLVMTMGVRVDVREGKLASYRRGCDAVVSRDNGLTWDTERRYVLDEYEFYDGSRWFNGECGHLYSTLLDSGQILTTHANYLTRGASLIRWKP